MAARPNKEINQFPEATTSLADDFFLIEQVGITKYIKRSTIEIGGSIFVPRTVFVDDTYGSNTTGLVERMDLPFKTLTAARSAALTLTPSANSRVRIVVQSGQYLDQPIILSNYIDYDLTNATIDVQSGSQYTIDDGNASCDSVIYGCGTIKRTGAGSLGAIRTQHASTKLLVWAKEISTTIGKGIVCTNGTQTIRANKIDSTIDRSIACEAGTQIVYVTLIQSVEVTGGIQIVYGSPTSNDFSPAVSAGGIQTIYGNVIMGGDNIAANCQDGTQIIYGDVSNTMVGGGTGANSARTTGAGTQKIYGNITSLATASSTYCVRYASTSTTSEYHGDINSYGGPGIHIISGGIRLKSGSRVKANKASQQAIFVASGTPAIKLESTTLVTDGVAASIDGTVTVKVYGMCQANVAAAGTVTQQVGTITISTDVN